MVFKKQTVPKIKIDIRTYNHQQDSFIEKAISGFYKSIHYVNALCQCIVRLYFYHLSSQVIKVLLKFETNSNSLNGFVQALYISMDQYLQGLFIFANDPAAKVRKLVSS